ncbi:MAG TPA: hypothetical protein VGR11_01715 [Solirubrobacteraceae bacterium]|nr:hypothetical protein [Solirubrobacteraceae bacterium]
MTGAAQQHRDEGDLRARALKVRIAAISTTSLVVSLAVVPEALARLAVNHNETVLALD